MYILNIDTSSDICSVSVFSNGKFINYQEVKEKNSHASKLAPITNQLLKELNIKANRLAAVAINKGPGSYTGLRIGTAFAKGLCYALNIPLLAIDCLKILAQDFLIKFPDATVEYICPMLDARRMEVYTALFDVNLNTILNTQALILTTQSFHELAEKKIAFLGNGVSKFKFLKHDAPNSFMFYPELYPNAMALGYLSFQHYQQHAFEDIAYFEPQYLKDFIPTTPKDKFQ